MVHKFLKILFFIIITPFFYGNTSFEADKEEKIVENNNSNDIENILINQNAKILSLLIPEIEEIVNSKTISLDTKINEIILWSEEDKNNKLILKKKALEAFEKAENLFAISKIKEASFYYSVACFFDKENPKYLNSYIKRMLEWVDRNIKNSKEEVAFNLLLDIEQFLYSNLSLINPDNLDNIFSQLKEIEVMRKNLDKHINALSYNENLNSFNYVKDETLKLLSIPIPDGLDKIMNYHTKLQTLYNQLMKFYTQNQSEETFIILKNLSVRISEVAPREEAERILLKGNKVLEIVNKEQKYDYIYIEEAVLINQRLHILSFTASSDLRRRINIYNKSIEELLSKSSQISGSKIIKKLENKFNAIKAPLVKNETNAEKALSSLYNIQNEVIASSSSITDATNLKLIKKIISDIEKEIMSWKDIQQSRYEKWAINTIVKFNNVYKDELGLLGSGRDTKKRIYIGLVDYLCAIDLRYLSVPSLRAYTEVFDFYYKELDRDQRLDLSKEFISCDKKLLSEF